MDSRTRHLLKIGLVANIFEWYEFFISVFLSGLIGQLFFKSPDPIIELIRAYSLFFLSFIARPLGGLVFGWLGDRISRGYALRLSLILMAIPTFLIGLLPTHDPVGMLTIIILVSLRLIQGFSAGGELPTTACYVFENSPSQDKSLLLSIITASPKIGMLLASLVSFLLFHYFDEQVLLAWAWRIPFLLSIPLTLVIIYIRKAIQEDPIISVQPTPVATSLAYSERRSVIKPIAKAVGLVSFSSLCFYTILVWMPSYLSYFLGIPSNIAYFINTLTLCAILPLYLIVPSLSKRYGYSRLILASIFAILVFIIPLFKGLQTYSSWTILFALQFILSLIFIGIDAVIVETLCDLFPHARSLSFGIAWTFSATFIGGTTPLVFTYVIHKTGWLMFPAFYIMAFGLVALLITLRLKPAKAIDVGTLSANL